MVRYRESAEDEDQGWGNKKSPYEYNGKPTVYQRELPQTNPYERSLRDSLARQERGTPSGRISDNLSPQISKNPRGSRRNIGLRDVMDAKEKIPEFDEVMKGLVPIGDSGFYSVPDEAARINDCERWPDSPACGGQPLTNLPIGFEDQALINDECNTGFTFTPVAGFIKLPKVQLVYRRKKCREEKPQDFVDWEKFAPKEDWLPPDYGKPHSCIPNYEDENKIVYVGVGTSTRKLQTFLRSRNGGTYTNLSAFKSDAFLQPPQFPGDLATFRTPQQGNQYIASTILSSVITGGYENKGSTYITGNYKTIDSLPSYRLTEGDTYKGKLGVADGIDRFAFFGIPGIDQGFFSPLRGRTSNQRLVREYKDGSLYVIGAISLETEPFILYGKYKHIKLYLKQQMDALKYDRAINDITGGSSSNPVIEVGFQKESIGLTVCWILDPETGEIIEPKCTPDRNPRKKKKRCCMKCCPAREGDNSLLKAIYKKVIEIDQDVERLKKQIGEPINVKYREEKNTDKLKDFGFHNKSYKPDTIFKALEFCVNRVDDLNGQMLRLKQNNHVLQPLEFLDGKLPKRLLYPGGKGDEKINGYADIGKAQIRQIDKAVGLLPFEIKIGDANAGKAGLQPVKVKIASFADAAKLLIEHSIDNNADIDTGTNMLVRLLYLGGQTLQTAAMNNQILENIEGWMDYPVEHKTIDLPLIFNPLAAGDKAFEKGNAGKIDENTEKTTEALLPELLKEIVHKLKVPVFKGGRTLKEILLEQSHHIMTTSGANSIPYTGVSGLRKVIEGAVLAQKIHGQITKQNVAEVLGTGDLNSYLKQVEQGYETTAPDRTEKDTPYNKPQKNRPKAKRVSRATTDPKPEVKKSNG